MRWFLLLIALAIPVALARRPFWALVAIEFGATPSTYVYEGGRTQQALLGPKAPWPARALVPDGTALTVRAWFGPSPPDPETGYGDFCLA